MPMNFLHRKLCSSKKWAAAVADILPNYLAAHELGEHVLEIGPGFGATTRILADGSRNLTALEVDKESAELLRAEFAGKAEIVHGDGAKMPFEDGTFSAVVCFTMMHHVPSPELQDAIFGEAFRVLRPGGVFTGTDSQLSVRFRLLHIHDTMTVLDARTLPDRLRRAGFADVDVRHRPKERVAFTGRKPAPAGPAAPPS